MVVKTLNKIKIRWEVPPSRSIYLQHPRSIRPSWELLALNLITKSQKDNFIICTDSLSSLTSIKKLKHGSSCVTGHLHKYVTFCWVPSHVCIQGNERLDALARLALNEPNTNIKIPYAYLLSYVKLHLRKNWQFFWDQQVQSKLHVVHPELGLWITVK